VVRTQLESARDIVVREYESRRTVQLDTSGKWHRCSRRTCDIQRLTAHVCLDGDHIVEDSECEAHPYGTVIGVKDLYVCKRIGVIHVCDRVTCHVEHGQCEISGQACAAKCGPTAEVPPSNKRTRRRAHGVHTNEQSACILLYDLLFSTRRVQYETHRLEAMLDVARRSTQRLLRMSAREKVQMRYQAAVDVYAACRQRQRSVTHLTRPLTDDEKQAICRYYAATFVQAWTVLSPKMPYRCSFECTVAAMLYGMRRGVACDGILAIPKDPFLANALPDAHAIAEVHISRRAFTQAKNALFSAMQTCVHEDLYPVERFARIFNSVAVPVVLQSFLEPNVLEQQ